MKKITALLTVLFLVFQLQAQENSLLDSIKAINSQIKSFDADLSNTMVKPKETTSQNGKLYYVSPNNFAAQFVSGEYMIVNESRIKMNIGIFYGTYKLKEGGMMQSLSNIFLYGFQGQVQKLADENGYNLTTSTINGYYMVTGTIKKKKLIGIGYKQVVFKYDINSLLLKEIVLYDYSGNIDTYTISNIQYNVDVDPDRFLIN